MMTRQPHLRILFVAMLVTAFLSVSSAPAQAGSISSIIEMVGQLIGQVMEVHQGIHETIMGSMGSLGPVGGGLELTSMVSDAASGVASSFLGEGNIISQSADLVSDVSSQAGERVQPIESAIRTGAGTASSQSEDIGH